MKNKLAFPMTLFVLLIIAYFPVLTVHQTVSPDAYFLLPFFDKMESLKDYLHHLFTLRAYDIQPIRDLSLFIDWKIFHYTKFNVFIWHNIVLWLVTCLYIKKILNKILPEIDDLKAMIYTGIFSIYPLFVGSISWSIARKHILALMFIILATYYFLDWIQNLNKRSRNLIFVFYFLSIFSQPISILWPFWAFIYLFAHKKKELMGSLIPVIIIFIFGFSLNYIYYTQSQFFSGIFEGKMGDTWRFDLKLFAIGQYFQEIFLPYEQNFQYGLIYKYTIQGYLAFFTFTLVYFFLKREIRFFLLWFIFAAIPIGVVINTPRLIMDYYLLISGVGFFILTLQIFKNLSLKKTLFIVILPFIFWTAFTQYQSRFWADEIKFGFRNFYTRPNCVNSKSIAATIFSKGQLPPQEIIQFMDQNNCYEHRTPYQKIELIVYLSYLTFYGQNTPLEEKISTLKKLAEENFFPRLALAHLYIQNKNYDEANKELDLIAITLGPNKLDNIYDKTIPSFINDYCERTQNQKCLFFSRQLAFKPDLPYF